MPSGFQPVWRPRRPLPTRPHLVPHRLARLFPLRSTSAAWPRRRSARDFSHNPPRKPQRTLGRSFVQPGNVENTGAAPAHSKVTPLFQSPWLSRPRVLYIPFSVRGNTARLPGGCAACPVSLPSLQHRSGLFIGGYKDVSKYKTLLSRTTLSAVIRSTLAVTSGGPIRDSRMERLTRPGAEFGIDWANTLRQQEACYFAP